MTKQTTDNVFRWVAGVLASVLMLAGMWGFRTNAATEDQQWLELRDHDERIGENAMSVNAISVKLAVDDRRITESLERFDKRQDRMDRKLDEILERLPR